MSRDLYSDAFKRYENVTVRDAEVVDLSFLCSKPWKDAPEEKSQSPVQSEYLDSLPFRVRDLPVRGRTPSMYHSNYSSSSNIMLPAVATRRPSAMSSATGISNKDDDDLFGAETVIERSIVGSRVAKTRSLAPPDILRYGRNTEEEMQYKDSVIDRVGNENADLEDILADSNEILKESATAHFRRRMEEHYKAVAVNRMLDNGSKVGGDAPMLSITVPTGYDNYTTKPMYQTESAFFKPFTPENLGFRHRNARPHRVMASVDMSSPGRLSFASSPVGNKLAGLPASSSGSGLKFGNSMKALVRRNEAHKRLAKTAPFLREKWRSELRPSNLTVITERVDYGKLLTEQMDEQLENADAAIRYNKLLKSHFESQADFIAKLAS